MMYLLNVKNISKSFGSKQVLHEVNLKVTSGELFGLLGANGAGKKQGQISLRQVI